MKKLLFIILCFLPIIVNAQFSNDGVVYGFKVYKKISDGVPEKVINENVMLVYFYDYNKVWIKCVSLSEYRNKKYKDAQYPHSEMVREIKEEKDKRNKRPINIYEFTNMTKFDSQLSNSK